MPELRPAQGTDILQDQPARITEISVSVAFDIETHAVVPFRNETFGPPPNSAVEIDNQTRHFKML